MATRLAVFTFLCLPSCMHTLRLAELDEQTAEDTSTAVVVKPHNYWMAESATQRCKEARRGRWARRIVGAVVGILFAVPVALVLGLGTSALYWTWYLQGAKSTLLFVSMVGAGALTAWSSIATMQRGLRVGQWTVDVSARLFGLDGHKPSCCCWDEAGENDTSSRQCGIVGSIIGRKATCPEGAVHDAAACDMPEPEETFSTSTRGGCECKDVKSCSSNKFHRGHAWCIVKSGRGCKPQKRTWSFRHWDYCRIAAQELDENNTANEYLSKFVPNLDKGRFRLDPENAWRWGSYVDTSKGVVIVRVKHEKKWFKQSSCFAGETEETLDGCAMRCVEEGAVFADEWKGKRGNRKLDCHAFAYNRLKRLCVRLPKDATGAEFKPFQRNPALEKDDPRDGWQNFKRVFED